MNQPTTSSFLCPVCGGRLRTADRGLACPAGHRFDRAKSGYVNLFLSQRKGHGDDKGMVRARRNFLEKGYYQPLANALLPMAASFCSRQTPTVLDAGCGEGWYTAQLARYLEIQGMGPRMLGIDLSKNALGIASRRCPELEAAVASIFHLPVEDCFCDLLLSLFAPCCAEEFLRVLRPGGVFLQVFPLENHLWSLKTAIYDHPYPNEVGPLALKGFTLVGSREVRDTIFLPCGEDIANLFAMTPYFYRTSPSGLEKLTKLSELTTEIAFGLAAYQKNL